MPKETRRSRFERDGFVVVRDFLPSEEFSLLGENLDRYVREVVPTLPDADAFYDDRANPATLKQMQRMGGDPFFEAYRRHPRWVALAEELLGEAALAEQPEWFNKPPGTAHVTPPHQDNYYSCLAPPQVLTAWLALDDVDAENGCLRYVAGSHTRGYRPHARSNILGFSQGITDYRPDDFALEVAVPLRRRPGGPSRHDDPPGRCQHVAQPPAAVVRHGVSGSFLPARRRGLRALPGRGPAAAPGNGPSSVTAGSQAGAGANPLDKQP